MTTTFVPSYEKYMTIETINESANAVKKAEAEAANAVKKAEAEAANAVKKAEAEAAKKRTDAVVLELAKQIDALLIAPVWATNMRTLTSNVVLISPSFVKACLATFKVEAHQPMHFENYIINKPVIVCYSSVSDKLSSDNITHIYNELSHIFSKLKPILYDFSNGMKGFIVHYPTNSVVKSGREMCKCGDNLCTEPGNVGEPGNVSPVDTQAQTKENIIEKGKKEAKRMIDNVPKELLDYAELIGSKQKLHIKAYAKVMGVPEMSDIQYIDYLHTLGTTKYDYLKEHILNGRFNGHKVESSSDVGIQGPITGLEWDSDYSDTETETDTV